MSTNPTSVEAAAAAARNELTPTPVEEWGVSKKKNEDGFTTELPSGNVIKMRRTLDLPVLLQTGRIPNPLAGIVQGMMSKGTSEFPAEMQDPKAITQLMDLLDSTIVACVLEPPFSRPDPRTNEESDEDYETRINEWKPDEGTVSIFMMEMADKMYVFSVAQGAAADLSRFREEQATAMGAVPPVKHVPSPTKRTGGPSKPRKKPAKKS